MVKVHESDEFTTVHIEIFTIDKVAQQDSTFSIVKADMSLHDR